MSHGNRESRQEASTSEELTMVVMRNDLTVIRGQAQLMKRALTHACTEDARTVEERLDIIISSVDDASLELQQLQAARRPPRSSR